MSKHHLYELVTPVAYDELLWTNEPNTIDDEILSSKLGAEEKSSFNGCRNDIVILLGSVMEVRGVILSSGSGAIMERSRSNFPIFHIVLQSPYCVLGTSLH